MTLADTLISIWQQVMEEEAAEVKLESGSYRVKKTRSTHVKTLNFEYGEYLFTALEQNPEKKSRWAKMAKRGHKIMQFNYLGHFFGNVVDGKLTKFSAWGDLELPE